MPTTMSDKTKQLIQALEQIAAIAEKGATPSTIRMIAEDALGRGPLDVVGELLSATSSRRSK